MARVGPHPQPQIQPRGNVYPYPPQHHPETVFINAPAPARETSVNKITMPVVMACTAALFLIAATYTATTQFGEIKYSIDRLTREITQMSNELTNRVNRLEQLDTERRKDAWSRADHELWCARTEALNADAKFRCSDFGVHRIPPPSVPPLSTTPPPDKPATGWRTKP